MTKSGKKRVLLWMALVFFLFASIAMAEEYEEEPQWDPEWPEELSQWDFTPLDQVLEEIFPQNSLSFSQLVQSLLSGNRQVGWTAFWQYAKQMLWREWQLGKAVAWQVLLLGVLGAMTANLAGAFTDGVAAQIAGLVIYLTASVLLLQGIASAIEVAADGIHRIGRLMHAFCPVFFLAVAIQGQLTAAAMYEMALLLVQGVQWICEHVILNGIRMWMLLRILDGIFAEPMWEHLSRLTEKGIRSLMRAGVGAVVGFQAVQSLLLPYLDAVKGGALWKMASALPGVGNGLRGAAQLALGTAALLRNAMGMGGVIVLLAAALPALIQLLLVGLLYHCVAVVLQPVSEKRIQKAVAAAGDGCLLLGKVLGMGVLLFGIFIGIVCACFGRAG